MKIIIFLLFSLFTNSTQPITTDAPISVSSSIAFSTLEKQPKKKAPISKKAKKKRLKKFKKSKQKKGIQKTQSMRRGKVFLVFGIIALTLAIAGVIIGLVLGLTLAIFLIAALFGLWGTYCLIAGLITINRAGGFRQERYEKPVRKPSLRDIETF